MDNLYFEDNASFRTFSRRVVASRLHTAGIGELPLEDLAVSLSRYFEDKSSDTAEDVARSIAQSRTQLEERPYFKKLRSRITTCAIPRSNPNLRPNFIADEVIARLSVPEHPLIEKTNCFLLFRAWNKSKDLLAASDEISAEAKAYLRDPSARTSHSVALDKFRRDLLAQIFHDYEIPYRYMGIESFISMSGGNLRNLLIVLKDVFRWAAFTGEKPLTDTPISGETQGFGIREASNWFYIDSQPLGEDGEAVLSAVAKLADMFRLMRYSDKPVESSLISFSVDLTKCSPETKRTIKTAEQWSLLIGIDKGEKHRNSGQIIEKFQLNPMLCPRWNLPLSRRGTIAFTADEANAIFSLDSDTTPYQQVLDKRLSKLNAPFAGISKTGQPLPGFENV